MDARRGSLKGGRGEGVGRSDGKEGKESGGSSEVGRRGGSLRSGKSDLVAERDATSDAHATLRHRKARVSALAFTKGLEWISLTKTVYVPAAQWLPREQTVPMNRLNERSRRRRPWCEMRSKGKGRRAERERRAKLYRRLLIWAVLDC